MVNNSDCEIRRLQSDYFWLEGKKIAFIGDSVTADLGNNYVTLVADSLADLIDMTTVRIINSGVESSSVLDALDRLPDVLIEHDPDVFVFFLGINDSKIFRRINKPLLSLVEFEKSYVSLINRANSDRQRFNILVTLPPLLFDKIKTGELLQNYWYWNASDYSEYINTIRKIAKQPNCTLADIYNRFLKTNSTYRLFLDDGVHPNIYGHKLIADAILDSLAIKDSSRITVK